MSLKQAVKNILPAPVFHLLRDLPWRFRDMISEKPADLGPMPPLRLMFDGPRGYDRFASMGRETLEFYKNVIGVEPDATILDIGCGIGRKTLPLLSYLNNKALYVGMDVDRRGIDWLIRNVTSQNERFVFIHMDIFNKFYNQNGALLSSRLVLPFPDSSFDIVVLWSVFTHMYPRDVAHYLSEIARVLKPGGCLVASYYLYNAETLNRMQSSQTLMNFSHELEQCRTTNPNMPEDALAMDDQWLKTVHQQMRLEPVSIYYGEWSGHAPYPGTITLNFQDIVIAQRRDSR